MLVRRPFVRTADDEKAGPNKYSIGDLKDEHGESDEASVRLWRVEMTGAPTCRPCLPHMQDLTCVRKKTTHPFIFLDHLLDN